MSAWMEYTRTLETPEYIAGFSLTTGGVDENLENILRDMQDIADVTGGLDRGLVPLSDGDGDDGHQDASHQDASHQDTFSILDHTEPRTLDLSKYLQ